MWKIPVTAVLGTIFVLLVGSLLRDYIRERKRKRRESLPAYKEKEEREKGIEVKDPLE